LIDELHFAALEAHERFLALQKVFASACRRNAGLNARAKKLLGDPADMGIRRQSA